MDTFTAIPSFIRVPLTILDRVHLEEWMSSDDLDAPPPTKTQIFICYTKGAGTPVPVQIEVDAIETEYSQALPSDEDNMNLSTFELSDKWNKVNMLLRRNLLCAVVRGLDIEDANILANNPSGGGDGEGYKLLVKAGWIRSREEILAVVQDDEAKSESENKEEGEDVTGE